MKKMYENEWLGIPFKFINTSHKDIAGSEFYNAFYSKVFEKYSSYEDLPTSWKKKKIELSEWLIQTIPDGSLVLSVGCGLGYVEYLINSSQKKRIEIHVQDYASDSLKWLKKCLPVSHIHDVSDSSIGYFDVIYLSAVDYALDDQSLIALVSDLKSRLNHQGNLIIISESFLDDQTGVVMGYLNYFKDAIKTLLHISGIRKRGQLWGWLRTREEYYKFMIEASFQNIEDGFIESPSQKLFWIKGTIS